MKWNSIKTAAELPDIEADVEFVTMDGQLREVVIHHENGYFKITRATSYSDSIQVMIPCLGDKAKRHKVTATTQSGRSISNTTWLESSYEASDLVRSLNSDGLIAKSEEVEVLIDDAGKVIRETSGDTQVAVDDGIPF